MSIKCTWQRSLPSSSAAVEKFSPVQRQRIGVDHTGKLRRGNLPDGAELIVRIGNCAVGVRLQHKLYTGALGKLRQSADAVHRAAAALLGVAFQKRAAGDQLHQGRLQLLRKRKRLFIVRKRAVSQRFVRGGKADGIQALFGGKASDLDADCPQHARNPAHIVRRGVLQIQMRRSGIKLDILHAEALHRRNKIVKPVQQIRKVCAVELAVLQTHGRITVCLS